mgnify:CR=1 FL=1
MTFDIQPMRQTYEGTWREVQQYAQKIPLNSHVHLVIIAPEEAAEEGEESFAPLKPYNVQEFLNPNHFYFTAPQEQFDHALDELAAMNENVPILSDGAFDREFLYEDSL